MRTFVPPPRRNAHDCFSMHEISFNVFGSEAAITRLSGLISETVSIAKILLEAVSNSTKFRPIALSRTTVISIFSQEPVELLYLRVEDTAELGLLLRCRYISCALWEDSRERLKYFDETWDNAIQSIQR